MKNDSRQGLVENLSNQVNAFFDGWNLGAKSARERNRESNLRFAKYLGENTHLQKMTNVEARHLYDYVQYMKEKGMAPSTIMSDLSGIRKYYKHNGCKNVLPKNNKLNLEKREVGKYDRAWLPQEIERCYQLATHMGRMDVVISMDFMLHFGLRLNEAASLKVSYLMKALNDGQLMVTGKGGYVRVIVFDEKGRQRAIVEKWLDYARANGKYPGDYLICDKKKRSVDLKKKSMQNWLSRAKDKVMEPNRETIVEDGKKPRKESASFHGLRHTFAQNYLTELTYMKPKDAKLEVSYTLGHKRIEITRVYMAEKKA
ncbi:MAG: tyrosine-type recombinase/integrase [Clostridia bacterium]|nr:tyrosine-type recombinase/integrase [Clostridia bacterium]